MAQIIQDEGPNTMEQTARKVKTGSHFEEF